jgi:hypothetical protein
MTATISIRGIEYTPALFTDTEVAVLGIKIQAYLEDASARPALYEAMIQVLPGLEGSTFFKPDRILLNAPELMLLTVKLQQWLINSPEYQAAVEELKRMPEAGRLVEAIEQVNAKTTEIARSTAQGFSTTKDPFFKAYETEAAV